MGDLSEMRGLVFVLAFITVFVLLSGMLFFDFQSVTYADPDSHENFDPNSIIAWNTTYTLNLTSTAFDYTFQLGGYNVRVKNWGTPPVVYMETFDAWWVFEWNFDQFHWYNKGGTDVTSYVTYYIAEWPVLSGSQLDSDAPDLTYQAKNSKTKITVTFVYNTTAYSSPSAAYNANALNMVFGMDWNDRNTAVNAWGLVATLLSFNLPVPYPLNFMIGGAIWACIAYMIFIFALRVVGAVFGGGGA